MDYSREEFDALVLFNDYIAQEHYVLGEDYIIEVLKKHPVPSILLNLHYAKYLKEVKEKCGRSYKSLGVHSRAQWQ